MKKILLTLMLLIGISSIGLSQTIDENGIYWLPKRQYEVIKIDRCQNIYEIYLLGEDNEIYKLLSQTNFTTRLFRCKSRKLVVGTKVKLTLNSWFSRSFGKDKISLLPVFNHRIVYSYGKCDVKIDPSIFFDLYRSLEIKDLKTDSTFICDLFESPEIKDLYYIGDN